MVIAEFYSCCTLVSNASLSSWPRNWKVKRECRFQGPNFASPRRLVRLGRLAWWSGLSVFVLLGQRLSGRRGFEKHLHETVQLGTVCFK